MHKLLWLFLVILSFVLHCFSTNLYQTCSTVGSGISSSNGTGYYSVSYIGFDLSNLTTQFYSTPYSFKNSTGTYYINICSGSSICEGGIACFVPNVGEKIIYAYPNSAYYYSYTNQMRFNYYLSWPPGTSCYSYSYELYVTCDYNYNFRITSVQLSYDCSLYVYATSAYVCHTLSPASYVAPRGYDYLTSPIYLKGKLPMFLLDKVSYNSDPTNTEFVGTLYYSGKINSYFLNGTLSNAQGQTSNVAFLYQGSTLPAKMFAYITPPTLSKQACMIIANEFDADDDDYILDWFSAEQNPYQIAQRQYRSVYFSKGSTFHVKNWAYSLSTSPYISMMQQTSNSLPVYLSAHALAPFAVSIYDDPPFISELNWVEMYFNPIPDSMFQIPSGWNCAL